MEPYPKFILLPLQKSLLLIVSHWEDSIDRNDAISSFEEST
jgi:hypothetical protein